MSGAVLDMSGAATYRVLEALVYVGIRLGKKVGGKRDKRL